MEVALDNLGRDGGGTEAEFHANIRLDSRRKVRAGPDRSGQFADGDALSRRLKPLECAAEFVEHHRHLHPESHWLRVNAMASPDHRRELVFARPSCDHFAQCFDVGNEKVGRLDHLHRKAGIHDVTARQTKVQPAAGGRADVFSDICSEGENVMVECFFEFFAALHIEGRTRLHDLEIFSRHHAFLHERFTRE